MCFRCIQTGADIHQTRHKNKNGTSVSNQLLMADSAMSMSSSFLKGIAEGRQFMESKTPFFYGHYEYPQGHDPAASIGHSFIKTKTKFEPMMLLLNFPDRSRIFTPDGFHNFRY